MCHKPVCFMVYKWPCILNSQIGALWNWVKVHLHDFHSPVIDRMDRMMKFFLGKPVIQRDKQNIPTVYVIPVTSNSIFGKSIKFTCIRKLQTAMVHQTQSRARNPPIKWHQSPPRVHWITMWRNSRMSVPNPVRVWPPAANLIWQAQSAC